MKISFYELFDLMAVGRCNRNWSVCGRSCAC